MFKNIVDHPFQIEAIYVGVFRFIFLYYCRQVLPLDPLLCEILNIFEIKIVYGFAALLLLVIQCKALVIHWLPQRIKSCIIYGFVEF